MDLYGKAIELIGAQRQFAFVKVVHSMGSTPQKAGAGALIEPNGTIWGTIGGGCLEAETKLRALKALDDGSFLLFDLKLDEVTGWDDGLICGGHVRVFVDSTPERNLKAYQALKKADASRTPGILLTLLDHSSDRIGQVQWLEQNDLSENKMSVAPAELQQILNSETPGRILTEKVAISCRSEIYVEPIIPFPNLLIAGGGHIGKACAHLGKLMGFKIRVIDDRPSFADKKHIPDADSVICGDIASEIKKYSGGPETYILIVTRGHRHDGAVLAACIHSGARFIGMIGSRRKSALIRKSLVDESLASQEIVNRVVSPVGLDIGSQSVQEIALSIIAQIVAVRRKGRLDAEAKNFIGKNKRNYSGSGLLNPDGTAETASSVR
jgi:xanthine dehydrogenase accessory factor